jgi:hypothetical protein
MAEWVEAVSSQDAFLESFGDHLPAGIRAEHEGLAERLHLAITPDDLHGRDFGA